MNTTCKRIPWRCCYFLEFNGWASNAFRVHLRNSIKKSWLGSLKTVNLQNGVVNIVGYVICEKEISIDLDKIEASKAAPSPFNTKLSRNFLDITGYFCRYMTVFAEKSLALFPWNLMNLKSDGAKDTQVAFDMPKELLTTLLFLSFGDFEEAFIVETDASFMCSGAIWLPNGNERNIHSIYYDSRILTICEKSYTTSESERLELIFDIQNFSVYLLFTMPLKLITDHKAFQYAFKKKHVHGR